MIRKSVFPNPASGFECLWGNHAAFFSALTFAQRFFCAALILALAVALIFLGPNKSAAKLARQLDVPTNRVTEILNGRRAITGDTALRLAHFFGTTAEFWLNLQSLYELRVAQKKVGKSIKELPTLKRLKQVRA